MSIATKTGDAGTTALYMGKRVDKDHPRVCAYGTVDELNSALGLCRALTKYQVYKQFIFDVQQLLISLMAELSVDNLYQEQYMKRAKHPVTDQHLSQLDAMVEKLEAACGGFSGWIIPGDNLVQAHYDLARTTCRRAERAVMTLKSSGGTVRPVLLQYLNRLADVLWLLGRELVDD